MAGSFVLDCQEMDVVVELVLNKHFWPTEMVVRTDTVPSEQMTVRTSGLKDRFDVVKLVQAACF